MGAVRNITHNQFPKQGADLGDKVEILFNDSVVPATMVRADVESPNKKVYKTDGGFYVADSELLQMRMPRQHKSSLNTRAEVCFHFDTSHTLEGAVVRSDTEEPYLSIIHLDDGRVVYTTECMWRPISKEVTEPTTPRVNVEIEQLNSYLRKRKSSDRARILHGIYKQLTPSRKGKTTNGHYHQLVSKKSDVVLAEDFKGAIELIMNKVTVHELVGYLVGEMQKYEHLRHHAARLQEAYTQPVKVHATSLRSYGTTLN